MAILDQQTVLWDNVALTTSAYSTNSYDSGVPGATPVSATPDLRDISVGEPLAMVVFVTVAALHVGTETYEFDITQSASSTASSSPDTLVQVAFTTTQAGTLLKAGAVIVVPLPEGSVTKRYISGHYVSANSAGISVTAAILPMRDVTIARYYATAIVIQ
jgi:Flp pilus assembly protein CpaB